MENSYLTAKITKEDVTVLIDGVHKTVSRKMESCDIIISLCREYNESKDIERRKQIKEELVDLLSPAKKIECKSDGRFEFDGKNKMYLSGTTDPLPEFMASKILQYIEDDISLDALVNFWKHLLLNPDKRVRQQLFGFLENNGHPITDKGYFLAYKSVKVKKKYDKKTGKEILEVEYDEDTGKQIKTVYNQTMKFQPFHSGSHGMVIEVGVPVNMPREECDSNPEITCSKGLHVGSMAYVHSFGASDSVILEVLVSPRNVVAVPTDYNNTKMRCCEYYPISISNGENDNIYLESDYSKYDEKEIEKCLKEYEENKKKSIEELENELKMKKKISGELIS